MAKSLLSIRTKKKPKVTKSEAYMVNLKYLGDEPVFKGEPTIADLCKAFNWYNSMASENEAREFVKQWMIDNNGAKFVKMVSKIPSNFFPLTAAWVYRMHSRGVSIPKNELEYAHRLLANAMKHQEEEKPETQKSDQPNIQQRIRERVADIIGDVEEMIDRAATINMYEWLQKNEIPAQHAKKIAEFYKPLAEEYLYAMVENNEGYEHYTKPEMKQKHDRVTSIINDCEKYSGNTKKAKAVRKPRPVSIEKLLKNIKFQKESKEYKVVSVTPEKLINSQEVFLFNTKYGTITHMKALDRGGLSVKGTSIIKYDENESKTYKTGRKTQTIVDNIVKGNKTSIKKILVDLKSEVCNNRTNENTVILKVM